MTEIAEEAVDETEAEALALTDAMSAGVLSIDLSNAPFKILMDRTTGERSIVVGPVLTEFVIRLEDGKKNWLVEQLTNGIQLARTIPKMKIPRSKH